MTSIGKNLVLRRILALAFGVPMLITKNLWLGTEARFYAHTPILHFLPEINYPLDQVIYWSLLGLLLGVFVFPKQTRLIHAFLVLVVAYSLWDQSRWMPYNYQFVAMLLLLSTYEKESSLQQNALQIVLISIWFWSGLHKINVKYFVSGYPWMLSVFHDYMPAASIHYLNLTGLATPFIEAGAALLLLFRRTRKIGVIFICLMHGIILLLLGPLGHNWNHSVWSWNIAMILLCIALFWDDNQSSAKEIVFGKATLHKLVLTLFLLAPILNQVNLWDSYLSHSLYSWSTRRAEIELKSNEIESTLPDEVKPSIKDENGRRFISVSAWSGRIFNSPPYNADRVFKSVFRKLCKATENSPDLELDIYEKPNPFTGKSKTRSVTCGEL